MLLSCLATTSPLAEVFSDAALLEAMLDFESALARVEARLGLIPNEPITAAASDFDIEQIAAKARAVSTPAIPFVKELSLTSPNAHWGATSQDLMDTAMVMLLRRAWPILQRDHVRITGALRRLSEDHASTPMLARTLLQPASPVTFGWKAAGWYASVQRSWERAEQAMHEAVVLQFGGPSGTLSALGADGPAVSRALAAELLLMEPSAPWHSHRDRTASLVSACAIYAGALAKIARDIILLMQFEVGEVAEASGGVSSAMPHKRNPARCVVVLAAAQRLPGLASTMLSLLVQEHERAAGSWQAEWPVVAEAVQCTGSACEAMARVLEGLQVFPDRMLANIDATSGAVFSERATIELAKQHGRAAAYEMVDAAVRDGRPLDRDMAPYLESAEYFRKRLLSQD